MASDVQAIEEDILPPKCVLLNLSECWNLDQSGHCAKTKDFCVFSK